MKMNDVLLNLLQMASTARGKPVAGQDRGNAVADQDRGRCSSTGQQGCAAKQFCCRLQLNAGLQHTAA